MKIIRETDSVCEVLELDKRHPRIISFVGAGGKTTLLFRLSEELKREGLHVIVTTTTKMYKPEKDYVEWTGQACVKELNDRLRTRRVVSVGRTVRENGMIKMEGIPGEAYPVLEELSDILLVEADGSRRKPFKVPAEHEPVLFPGTDLVVAVLGMRSIGMRLADAAQRPEDAARFLQTDVGHRITREDLEAVFESPCGLRKGVDCAFLAVGNHYE